MLSIHPSIHPSIHHLFSLSLELFSCWPAISDLPVSFHPSIHARTLHSLCWFIYLYPPFLPCYLASSHASIHPCISFLPSPSLPTLCPSVAQRLGLGWAVSHPPGTHPGLDAAGLDPLLAGLVYGQGTEAPVLSPSRRQIITSFKCILSVEGNSFSGCRQSACTELIVTVALISIPARPCSLPPSGMAGVQVCAWAGCRGHPGCPHHSRT